MNYIREAENVLWYYRDLYQSIELLTKRIGKLISNAGPSDISAMVLDDTGIRSKKVDDALNVLFEIQKLTELRKETQEAIADVDKILNGFENEADCKYYGIVLRKWYIERVPKEDIAREIGYSSKQTIYDIKNRAIRKFAVMLYGIDALKVV
jgi:hypothetical protein